MSAKNATALRRISRHHVRGRNGINETCRWTQPLCGAGVPPAVCQSGLTAQKHRRDAGATKLRGNVAFRRVAAILRAVCEKYSLAVVVMTLFAFPVRSQQVAPPAILREVSITQRLNEPIPPEITFRDENGNTVHLADYFGKKPIVLSLVYFDCPALCTEVLNGELHTMKAISLDLGKDFDAITVSFEAKDTPALAKAKRDVYAGQYGRSGASDNWHFLTGDRPSIDALTQAAGFHYAYDSASKQYAHAAAILVLTPQGRIARYFYGVQYPSRDFRLGLVEASDGKIGTATDHALLYCYQYDPATGKYGIIVMNVVRAAGLFTVLVLGIFMFVMFRRERTHPNGPPPVGVNPR